MFRHAAGITISFAIGEHWQIIPSDPSNVSRERKLERANSPFSRPRKNTLPRRTSNFSGRDETRKYRGEERANSLADFHLDNQIPPSLSILLTATIHCHENWKSLINRWRTVSSWERKRDGCYFLRSTFFGDISRRIPSSWGCLFKCKFLAARRQIRIYSGSASLGNMVALSRSVAGNKKACTCNGRMRNNDPANAMSTVVNMIRESLITFQTFACRTRTRAQRWNCIPCAVLKKNADGFWISVMIPKILAFLSKTPPFHQPRNNFNEGTRKIRVNWGYFPASDTNLHKLSVGTRSRPRNARQRGYLLLTVHTEIWRRRARKKKRKEKEEKELA